jgi:hypothetical protein
MARLSHESVIARTDNQNMETHMYSSPNLATSHPLVFPVRSQTISDFRSIIKSPHHESRFSTLLPTLTGLARESSDSHCFDNMFETTPLVLHKLGTRSSKLHIAANSI